MLQMVMCALALAWASLRLSGGFLLLSGCLYSAYDLGLELPESWSRIEAFANSIAHRLTCGCVANAATVDGAQLVVRALLGVVAIAALADASLNIGHRLRLIAERWRHLCACWRKLWDGEKS